MYIFCTIWKVPLVWWMDEYSGRWTVPFLFAKECSIAAKAADLLIYYNQRLDLVQVLWQLQALGVLSPSIGWIFWHWWLFCFDDCCCAAQTLQVPSHVGAAWLWKKTKPLSDVRTRWFPLTIEKQWLFYCPCQRDEWKRRHFQYVSSLLELLDGATYLELATVAKTRHQLGARFPSGCRPVGVPANETQFLRRLAAAAAAEFSFVSLVATLFLAPRKCVNAATKLKAVFRLEAVDRDFFLLIVCGPTFPLESFHIHCTDACFHLDFIFWFPFFVSCFSLYPFIVILWCFLGRGLTVSDTFRSDSQWLPPSFCGITTLNHYQMYTLADLEV